jgi:hypothetical protein
MIDWRLGNAIPMSAALEVRALQTSKSLDLGGCNAVLRISNCYHIRRLRICNFFFFFWERYPLHYMYTNPRYPSSRKCHELALTTCSSLAQQPS